MTTFKSPITKTGFLCIEPGSGGEYIVIEVRENDTSIPVRFTLEMVPAIALAALEAMKLDTADADMWNLEWPVAVLDAMENLRDSLKVQAGAKEQAAALEDAKFMARINANGAGFDWNQLNHGTQSKWIKMATAMRERNGATK